MGRTLLLEGMLRRIIKSNEDVTECSMAVLLDRGSHEEAIDMKGDLVSESISGARSLGYERVSA